MNQWPTVKLGDVYERKIPKWDRDGRKKHMDISTISLGTKKVASPQDVLGEDAPSRVQQIIRKNDVFVSTVRPNLNPVAKIPSTPDGHVASTDFCVLRATEKIDSGFLFHFVQTQAFIKQCINKSIGISYPSITANKIKEILISLPPLEKQTEIAEVLRNSAQQITLQQNSIEQTSSICSNYYSLTQKDNYPELSLVDTGITKTSGKSITAKDNNPHETNRVLKVNTVSSGSFKPEESKPLPKSYPPRPSRSICYEDLLVLPFSKCVDLPLQLLGVDQAPRDVVVKIPGAQSDSAQVLEPAVDGLGRPIGRADIEAGQHVLMSAPQGAPQLGELLQTYG